MSLECPIEERRCCMLPDISLVELSRVVASTQSFRTSDHSFRLHSILIEFRSMYFECILVTQTPSPSLLASIHSRNTAPKSAQQFRLWLS